VTNSLGFREDTEVRAVKPDLRVLVTGDSHTDGVCENADSFANVLEALLAKQEPARSVEVLNAGLGGYSFYNYLGVLERYRDLDPDVFVVACYGGNDFLESLKVWHYFRRTYGRGPGTDYNAKVRAAQVELGSLVDFESQSLRQAATFEEVPEDVESALSAARGVSAEILRQCERDGVKLVCVYIPPATNVQPWLLEPALSRALELLEISPEALAASDRIADLWLAFLQERGVATLDLRPLFRAATEPLYWKSDHHIDVRTARDRRSAAAARVGGREAMSEATRTETAWHARRAERLRNRRDAGSAASRAARRARAAILLQPRL
jgi:hypothetical protein